VAGAARELFLAGNRQQVFAISFFLSKSCRIGKAFLFFGSGFI
jgi:hypothetical protein